MATGRLERWNDDKGFGFIRASDNEGEVFVHISALRRAGMTRRPRIGDTIHYTLQICNDGRRRAVNARIEGVAPAVLTARRARPSRQAKPAALPRLLPKALTAVLALGVAFVAYDQFFRLLEPREAVSIARPSTQPKQTIDQRFSCRGKVYCSEMTSCDEARFYLRNCPGTKMDGDGDGIPCERQWCGGWSF